MVLRSWGQGTKSYKGVELNPVVSCTKIRTREANNDLYQAVQNIDIMGSWDYELIFVLVRFYLAIIFKIFHIVCVIVIISDSFDKMQDYLSCNDMSTEEKQLLFKFRTRTYPCKTNFRNLYEPDLSCSICLKEDSPEHLFN